MIQVFFFNNNNNWADVIILLAAHLHDIPNIYIRFNNNQSGSFGNYKHRGKDDRQTDRQTDRNGRRHIFSYSYETSKNIKVTIRRMHPLTIFP